MRSIVSGSWTKARKPYERLEGESHQRFKYFDTVGLSISF
jgi:hypothetical protein